MSRVRIGTLAVALLAATTVVAVEEPRPSMTRRFDYDGNAPLGLQERGVQERNGVRVYDISYASPGGGRVPAYMVVPAGKGPFAGILFGHWAMKGSPTRNRTEFLEEAVALAQAGAVSLLIDSTFVRPGAREEEDWLSDYNAQLLLQQVLDMRRGVDLLLARTDIDPGRIAYVGHSYNAAVGGILAGVEKRIQAFVLMAGNLSDEDFIWSDEPRIRKWRAAVGEERIRDYFAKYGWLDPGRYVSHAAPAAVLLQYARHEELLAHPLEWAKRNFERVSEPKELRLYDAGHALNAAARRDRYEWLRKRLGLGELAPAALDQIPDTQ
jgi:cephalosporin-C deacetylase-like acetyl esterase